MDFFTGILGTCGELLEDMELERTTVSSALLRCLRIARLLNDTDAMAWLRFEYGGYPRRPDGSVTAYGLNIARAHGRCCRSGSEERVFLSLASELEERLDWYRYSYLHGKEKNTENYPDGADFLKIKHQYPDMSHMINNAVRDRRHLNILSSEYYSYVYRKYTELAAANTAGDIIGEYRKRLADAAARMDEDAVSAMSRMTGSVNSVIQDAPAQSLLGCRDFLGKVTEKHMKETGTLDEETAEELCILQKRLNRRLEEMNAGTVMSRTELHSCVIRTCIAAGDLLLGNSSAAEQ